MTTIKPGKIHMEKSEIAVNNKLRENKIVFTMRTETWK